MMSKLLFGVLGAGVIATGGYAAASGVDDADQVRTVSLPAATSTGETTTNTAEHTTTADTTTADTTTAALTTSAAVTTAEDVSGPCDEAEHRGDPRCTGIASGSADDEDRFGSNSGHGGFDDDNDDNDDDDRSGSNSGKG